nr:MAG TPA: hypothetical protein [Caudoviricetes sp.]
MIVTKYSYRRVQRIPSLTTLQNTSKARSPLPRSDC